MIWEMSHRADRRAKVLADQHYSRQNPEADQFMPPGSCLVLYASTPRGTAVWGTSWPLAEFVKHDWAGAWVCSIFRNAGAGVASAMITEAVAATRAYYGDPPALGMITFVDETKVQPTMVRGQPVFGWCFRKAGFVEVGRTKTRDFLALQLTPDRMPSPSLARNGQLSLAI